MNDGGSSTEFAKVRLHIREASHVFCNGGKNEKIFTCDKNYKTGHIGPSCPFGFTVLYVGINMDSTFIYHLLIRSTVDVAMRDALFIAVVFNIVLNMYH